jgi:hypothetical protein
VQARARLGLVVAGVAMIVVSNAVAATAKPSPKAVFDARVTAIGTEAQHALFLLPAATPSNPTKSAVTAGQLEAVYQRVAQRMGALTVPKAIAADFKILRAAYQADARYAAAWQDALLHGTPEQAGDAAEKLNINPEYDRARNAMGRMSSKGYWFGTFFR